MKFALLGIAVLLFAQVCGAEAPQALGFEEIGTCTDVTDPYISPDLLKLERSPQALVAVATVSLNCGSSVEATVLATRGVVSIALSQSFKAGASVAGCNCMRSFRMALPRSIRSKTPVYLVNQGQGTAHAIAP